MESVWTHVFFNNTVGNYAVALGLFAAGALAVWLVNHHLLKRLKRLAEATDTPLDDFLIDAVRRTAVPLGYLGAAALGLQSLTFHRKIEKGLTALGAALLTVFAVRFVTHTVRFLILEYWLRGDNNAGARRQVKGFMPVATTLIWTIGLVFLLDNLGFRISTVVAGLGIGGVAIALASQAVLGDLFSYFAILLDKPFEIGDFIILGDFMGSVEHIGLKTTRIRSLGGEELVFANTDLTGSRVRNYKRMQTRRIVFRLGVTYDTPLEKTKEIPQILKNIVTSTPNTRFDRAHFFSFEDWSLLYEIVYFVLSSDYNIYMDVQQQINFAVKAEFERRGIDFAFPTSTVHLAQGSEKNPK